MAEVGANRHWLRRFGPWIVAAVLGFVAWQLAPVLIRTWWTGLPRATRRSISTAFLNGCLAAHGVVLAIASIGIVVAATRVVTGRKRGQARPVSARLLLLGVTCLFSLGILELAAWGLEIRSRRPPAPIAVPPKIATASRDLDDQPPKAAKAGRDPNELVMLVVGESSAEGQPFEPWFSMGHAIAWQLERAKPGRKVRLVMTASGGVPLARVLSILEEQTERPDIVLMYSGHNEFQSRWGWSRVANYYPEDWRERPPRGRLVDYAGGITPFARLIRDAIDRQDVDAPPVLPETRVVVDRPIVDPQAREALREYFSLEIERVIDWCRSAGAVPIMVTPAGNDVGFDPDRSVLDPSTRSADRAAFAEEFLRARELEASSPEQALAAYRALLARQPLFAEAHYRLAKGLAARGEIDEARREFATARDLDGLPMRCPKGFQDAYRAAAAAHPEVVLVDATACLEALSPTKLLDDSVFHDGQHPSFRAYMALAQDALDQMRRRELFGLDTAALPPIDPSECAMHFGLDGTEHWADVCRRAASFWSRLAKSRYDFEEREGRASRLEHAAEAIERGVKPEETGVPGLGVRPAGFP